MNKNMKTTILIITTMLLSLNFYGQNKTIQEPITEIADIQFEGDEIIYNMQETTNVRMRPVLQIKDVFRIRTYDKASPVRLTAEMIQNLENELQNFQAEEADATDKERFIRAACLQIVWATMHKSDFKKQTLTKLQDLKQDNNDRIRHIALLAINLYQAFQEREYTRFELK